MTKDVPSLIAVDPSGRVVARLDQSTAPGLAATYGVWRSADGSTIFSAGPKQITAYSALDGTVQRTYSRAPGNVVNNAFSPDGHWLAMLLLDTSLQLQVIDLRSGSSQTYPVAHDPNANLPGMSCSGGSCADKVAWGMGVFAPDSTHVYTLTDWGGPTHLTAFSLEGGVLRETAAAVDGRGGRHIPSCSGPAMAGSVIGGGKTLVAFCHMDGAVWFFDLDKPDNDSRIWSSQRNPFALSPIFTPDGHLLYLHESGSGGSMHVIDLAAKKVLGPVPTPTKLDQSGPFGWLITTAHAGRVASTVPISPDGLKLYVAPDHGVMVLRVPDLKPLAFLAPAYPADEVWVSGDGRTLYAIYGKHLLVMGDDGSHQKSVTLADLTNGFIASEHG
jgi:WD40 repeat protein